MRRITLYIPMLLASACDSTDSDSLARCYPHSVGAPAVSQRADGPPSSVVAWTPPTTPPYEGPLTVNDRLSGMERFSEGELRRAEDLVVGDDGWLYTGSADGRIYRTRLDGGRPIGFEVFASTGAHALGLAFDPCGNLVAAVPDRGVVAIAPDGTVRTVVDQVDGTRIEYADELAVAPDGTIYVTDASTKYNPGWPFDFLEGIPHGRVVAYEPATGVSRVVASELHFPNGILVDAAESHVLFAESWRGRIQRHWLSGARAGTTEPFAENLPVIPDNITRDAADRIWIAGQRRTPELDQLSASEPARRQFLAGASSNAPPPPDPHVLVVVLDAAGRVVDGLHDTSGASFAISSALPHDGSLLLGTNVGAGIARVALER